MWYADIRGHHGKRWNYEPGDWYMGRLSDKERTINIPMLAEHATWTTDHGTMKLQATDYHR